MSRSSKGVVFSGVAKTPTDGGEQGEQRPYVTSINIMPHDNFSGRSITRFGLGEMVDLSCNITGATTASDGAQLKWFIDGGMGTVLGGLDGTATFTAPSTPGHVLLTLKFVDGESSGQTAFSVSLQILAPSGAYTTLNSNIRHTNGKAGVGFRGSIHFVPKDVSFSRIQFREGSAASVATGYFAHYDGLMHRETPTWLSVGPGDAILGCQLLVQDLVDTGNYPSTGFPESFSEGDFKWPIPWKVSVDESEELLIATALHHQSIDAAGTMTIEKAGAGPFSKKVDDPSSDY